MASITNVQNRLVSFADKITEGTPVDIVKKELSKSIEKWTAIDATTKQKRKWGTGPNETIAEVEKILADMVFSQDHFPEDFDFMIHSYSLEYGIGYDAVKYAYDQFFTNVYVPGSSIRKVLERASQLIKTRGPGSPYQISHLTLVKMIWHIGDKIQGTDIKDFSEQAAEFEWLWENNKPLTKSLALMMVQKKNYLILSGIRETNERFALAYELTKHPRSVVDTFSSRIVNFSLSGEMLNKALNGFISNKNEIVQKTSDSFKEALAYAYHCGLKKTDIYNGYLNSQEADFAIQNGCFDFTSYVLVKFSKYVGEQDDRFIRRIENKLVFRWLLNKLKNSPKFSKKFSEHYGPRLDEIKEEDLTQGEKTGVDEAFKNSEIRQENEWLKTNKNQEFPKRNLKETRFVKVLKTPLELFREGRDMGHCVKSYVQKCVGSNTVILSVKPHDDCSPEERSTVELVNNGKWVVEQHRSRFNKEPTAKCVELLDEFLKVNKIN